MLLKRYEVNSKLSKDNWFLSILLLGVVSGASSWAAIFCSQKPDFCWESSCFQYALELYKFPVQCIVASLALATLRGMVFRSAQTASQIELTIQQNTFKYYIDHKKQFMDMLKGFEEQHDVKFFNKDELYAKFFPNNSPKHVDFHAVCTGGDMSELEYLIQEYNKSVSEFNDIVRFYLAKDVDEKHLVRWLAGFLVVLLRLNIVFSTENKSTIQSISSRWKGFVLWDSRYISYPKNFDVAFYQLEDILNALIIYCLPDLKEKIELKRAVSFGENVKAAFNAISCE